MQYQIIKQKYLHHNLFLKYVFTLFCNNFFEINIYLNKLISIQAVSCQYCQHMCYIDFKVEFKAIEIDTIL